MIKTFEDIIIRAILIEDSRGSLPVYHRPYKMKINSQVADGIQSLGEKVGTSNFTTELLTKTGIAGAMSFDKVGQAAFMPYGWEARRLRWQMKIDVKYVAGQVESMVLQGYSDYHNPSKRYIIDPNCTFFVNNVTVINNGIGAPGRPGAQKIVSSNHIHMSEEAMDTGKQPSGNHNRLFSCRPQDILVKMETASSGGGDGLDTTTVIGAAPIMSRQTNVTPGRILANMLNAYGTASIQAEYDMGSKNVTGATYSNLIESEISDNPFLKNLSSALRHRNVSGRFRFGDLMKVYPKILSSNIIKRIPPNTNSRQGGSEYHNKHNPKSIIASSVQQQVKAAMYRTGLTWVIFTADNKSASALDGPNVKVVRADCSIVVNPAQAAGEFESIVKTEIMPYVTKVDAITVDIYVSATTYGETTVKVAVDGLDNNKPTPFTYASYADGLYAHTIDTKSTLDMGHHLELLFNTIQSPSALMDSSPAPANNNMVVKDF